MWRQPSYHGYGPLYACNGMFIWTFTNSIPLNRLHACVYQYVICLYKQRKPGSALSNTNPTTPPILGPPDRMLKMIMSAVSFPAFKSDMNMIELYYCIALEYNVARSLLVLGSESESHGY